MPELPPDESVARLRAAADELRRLDPRGLPLDQIISSTLDRLRHEGDASARALWRFDAVDGFVPIDDPDGFVRRLVGVPAALQTCIETILAAVGSASVLTLRVERDRFPGVPAGSVLFVAPVVSERGLHGAVQFVLGPSRPDAALGAARELAEAAGRVLGAAAAAAEDAASRATKTTPSGGATAPASPLFAPAASASATSPGIASPRAPAAGSATAEAAFHGRLEEFLYLLQQSVELEDVAATAASDGAILLGCDRLSVVVRRGGRTYVAAVSGQKSVNPRADATRALTALANAVIRTEEPLVFRGDATTFPEEIENSLAAFVLESAAREVIVSPVFRAEPLPDPKDAAEQRRRVDRRTTIVGALIVEQFTDRPDPPDFTERVRIVSDHVGARLGHALEQRGILFLSAWRSLGRLRERFVGRRRAIALLIAGAVAALLIVLAVVPWEYRVEGDGRLLPVRQLRVFAPWDGEIVEVHADGGKAVSKGDLLLRLRNDELRTQVSTARRQWSEKTQLAASLQGRAAEAIRNATKDEQARLQGDLERTRVEISGLAEEIRTLEERESQLEVRAPGDGTVATFQVEQLLLRRPVRRGELLLEVMDESGPWQLELQVPERRIGHVVRAQARSGTNLPVRFVAATAPEQTFDGTVASISTRASTQDDKERVVEVVVGLDAAVLPFRRVGAEVKGRIGCGRRSLGYVLFGDVVEFIRRHVWW